ncbi:MAG: 3-keto-5-aminohexanoate cleavage protein [Chloroflexi bacterium]|nr:3-keto-5-aminohexanoate cleavage protein [Chloroflexota bacterium]MDA8189671.1 3-keto-5-aminohexanoate cleavage protein [Dehalococcoidales bacterium]
MEKLIITAALNGGVTVPTQTPYLPITPRQIADEAARCADAGAAVVHIHARDPKTGMPNSDVEVFGEMLRLIRERTDLVVCTTTGGGLYLTPEQRLAVVTGYAPEMASCNMGSMNFSVHPITARFKREDYKFDWEEKYLLASKDFIFRNTFADMERFVTVMAENQTKSEFEIYDVGHLYNLKYLISQGLRQEPLWMQFVTGVLGGIGSGIEDMLTLKQTADRLFGSDGYMWSIIGVGYPQEFHLAALAIMMGGHVRVGLEDNLYIRRGVLAKSNAELVARAVKLAEEFERPVATPDEVRQKLKLKGKEEVRC